MLAETYEWRHIQASARRHARERSERMAVIAQRWSYGGQSGWHYVICSALRAPMMRRWRDHGALREPGAEQ